MIVFSQGEIVEEVDLLRHGPKTYLDNSNENLKIFQNKLDEYIKKGYQIKDYQRQYVTYCYVEREVLLTKIE